MRPAPLVLAVLAILALLVPAGFLLLRHDDANRQAAPPERTTPAPPPTPRALRGDWERPSRPGSSSSVDWRLSFDAGVAEVRDPRPIGAAYEPFAILPGGRLIFEGSGSWDNCKPGRPGNVEYRYRRAGARLRLTAVRENCRSRRDVLEGTWRRP